MSELFLQGLQVSALGMGLTFAALGLLILTIKALNQLFRERDTDEQETGMHTAVALNDENEVAAAIAVAISQMRSTDSPTSELGKTLEKGRGAWWQAGSGIYVWRKGEHGKDLVDPKSDTNFTNRTN